MDRMRLDIRSTNCDIPADERQRMETWISDLNDRLEGVGTSALFVRISFHPQSNDFNAELKLRTPHGTFKSRVKNEYLDSALAKSFESLTAQVEADGGHRKPTEEGAIEDRRALLERRFTNDVHADDGPLAQAVLAGDYQTFRNIISDYEDWLNRRVGRLIQRDPDAQLDVGNQFRISDVVEETYLQAFESFLHRPHNISLHEWLERLIDPALRALQQNREEEEEAVSYARTVRQARI